MTPGAEAFVLLALAAFRLTRLIGWDTLTEPARVWLTGYDDQGQRPIVVPPADDHFTHRAQSFAYINTRNRKQLAEWIHCPWCQGFWTTLAWWALWLAWPHVIVVASVPLAASAIVGVVAKQLDA